MRIVIPNYTIVAYDKPSDRVQTKTYSFYLPKALNKIAEMLEKNVSCNDGKRIRIMVKDKKTGMCTNIHVQQKDLQECMQKVKHALADAKGYYDIKSTRYKLVIINNMTHMTESKSIMFNSKQEFDKVFAQVHKLVCNKAENLNYQNITFAAKNKSTSHYATLVQIAHNKVLKTKSFSIYVPNYSSAEIIDEFKKELKA